MSGSEEPSMHYTEPGIRVITVFFAALVGFGLKHLADVTKCSAPEIYPHRGICFVLAVLLFLRFLLGSANHLWYEYVRLRRDAKTLPLGIDLGFLTCYGVIAVYICYAPTLSQYLWRSGYLPLLACFWLGVDAIFAREQKGWWKVWLAINIVQGSVLVCVALWMTDMRDPCFGYALWKVILFLVYFACLVCDFRLQMHVLKPKPEAETDAATAKP